MFYFEFRNLDSNPNNYINIFFFFPFFFYLTLNLYDFFSFDLYSYFFYDSDPNSDSCPDYDSSPYN